MKKLYIETYGCQMNVADSEVVAAVMQMAGYEPCDNADEADAVFLNTCSVRENAENKITHRLDALHAENKRGKKRILGVLGCMAERVGQGLIDQHHADLVAGPDAYLNLPHLMAQAELGQKAIDTTLSTDETYRNIVPRRITTARISGFVSIMRGCNNFCHYCIVPYTRGRERSRDVESILREVADLQQKGFKEVTLLGQNVNSYRFAHDGVTIGFPQLLRMVAETVPDMRVRFTTSHPKDMSDETLHAIAETPNICSHIHLPVQSGSNRILKLMNRKYTREWYLDRVDAIRRIIPDCGLSTDIFVGYHSETEEDHQLSLSLMREVGYDSAFMFKYSERPGTYASKHLPDDGRDQDSPTQRTHPLADRVVGGGQPARCGEDLRRARGGLQQTVARTTHGTQRTEQGGGLRQGMPPHRRYRESEDNQCHQRHTAGQGRRMTDGTNTQL